MAASPRTARDPPLFRAPPPSPAALPRDTPPEPPEDDDFSVYLKRSRRVPELILPHRNPPEIDLGSLISPERGGSEEENLRLAARSMGCFQMINHGIKESLIRAVVEAAEGIFGMPLERKKKASRSPERKWGFELEEEEEEVGETDEFFWWSGGAENMAGVLAQECDAFSGKMERLLKKTKKIAGKIELVLMESTEQYSIYGDSFRRREDVNNMILCLRKHRRSKGANFTEERAAFALNHETLGAFIRSLGSSHALSFHLFVEASRFRVYSKQAPLSFPPANGAVVVTVGDQIQEESGGMYRKAIGKPEYQWREARQEAISIAVLYSHATETEASGASSGAENGGEGEKTVVSVSKQLIMAAWFLVFCDVISYLWFAKS